MVFNYKHILALLLVVFIAAECKKKEEPAPEEPAPTNPVTGTSSITDVFASQGTQSVAATAIATAPQTVNVNNSVKLYIPANAFQTMSSGTVTGTVDLQVKTVMTKDEIILTGAAANSSSQRLVSTKGCVKVTATQNSQSLRLNNPGQFTIDIVTPTSTTTPVKKYYANKVTASDSTAGWVMAPDTMPAQVTFDGLKYHHHVKLDSLKWLNLGFEWDTTGAKTPVRATIPSQFNKSNTVVYISFNGQLTVGAMFEVAPQLFRIPNMPVGKGVRIVALSVINGKHYIDVKPVVITNGLTVALNPQEDQLSNILTTLKNLP